MILKPYRNLPSRVKAFCLSLLLLVFSFYPIFSFAAPFSDVRGRFRFSHLSAADGLAGQRVFSIVEGSDHAIWIATKNGVERYNGVTLQPYILGNDVDYSELTSRIIRLYKSKDGELYAFTNSGTIYRYDAVSNSFEISCDLTKIFSDEIILNDISVSEGKYWLALNTGLYSYRQGGKPFPVIRNSFVNDLMETADGLYVGTNNGLFYVAFTKSRPKLLFPNLQVQTSYYDKDNHCIFIGTFNRGLLIGDAKGGKIYLESPDIPHKPIRAITPLNSRTMLFGVDGGGVVGISRVTGKLQFLLSTDDETGAVLHGNGVYDVCCDEWGNVWIGSYSGGVDIAYTADNTFEVLSHEYLNPQSLFNNNVNDIMDDGHGNVYYATDRGVSIQHTSSGTWTHTMSGMVCLNLARDIDGKVIVATYGGGVRSVDGNAVYTKENGKLKTDYVFSLYNDGTGHLWIGCLDGDLALASSGGMRYFPIQNVQSISRIPDGRITIATANGFYAIDSNGRQSHYFTSGEFASGDVNVYIMSLLFTSSREVWLGTDGGGVYIYNMQLHSYQQLTAKDGLPSNSVKGLASDRLGRIWVTTDRGMACVRRKPRLMVYTVNVPHCEGIEYNRDATAMLGDGRIAFGSTTGAVIIKADALRAADYNAPIQLRDITVSGLNAKAVAALRPKIYKMLGEGKVVLPYSQNTFTLTFESINLKYQYDIVYQYRIDGETDDYYQTVSDGRILFNSLAPGKYRIHLRSVSRGTGRVVSEKILSIRILQPWWNSVWAWLIYICAIAVLIYIAWRFYRNRLQREYDTERINFFVNTAHDIRTPLSLTLAPLDDIARDNTLSDGSRKYLDIARRNGRQLMTLISTLLDFRKMDTRNMQLNITQLDLRQLLQQACSRFHLLSEQKHITLSLVSCPENATVWMDEKAANRILNNIISNTIKYTHENGRVEVGADFDGSNIVIYVRDNGIGIPEKSQRKIFSTFYRAENALHSKVAGSGLGLALVRKLVALHGGTVSFESKEGKGTTFFVKLPKGFSKQLESIVKADKADNPEKPATGKASLPVMLFVDDNAELRNYMELVFGRDYNVITEPDAQSALDYLSSNGCDIIVSDVMMPGMPGDEFCRRVKNNELTSFVPVILLTAKTGRDYAIGGLNCGADDYVAKPFDTSVLHAKVASLLRNRQSLREYYLHRAAGMAQDKPEAEEPAKSQEIEEDDKKFVDKATHIVMENMHDEAFDINSLCREMAMSRTLFYSRLKALTGQTPQDFMRMLRLERAAKLLDDGLTVFEASADTGFGNTKYFSTLFKKYFGVSPSKYHKE